MPYTICVNPDCREEINGTFSRRSYFYDEGGFREDQFWGTRSECDKSPQKYCENAAGRGLLGRADAGKP